MSRGQVRGGDAMKDLALAGLGWFLIFSPLMVCAVFIGMALGDHRPDPMDEPYGDVPHMPWMKD